MEIIWEVSFRYFLGALGLSGDAGSEAFGEYLWAKMDSDDAEKLRDSPSINPLLTNALQSTQITPAVQY